MINFISNKSKQFLAVVCLSAMLTACQNGPSKKITAAIQFELNADSTQIVLKGLDHNIVQSMQQDSIGQEELASIYSVYEQADNEEMVGFEKPLPGSIRIAADNLVFAPDSAFTKGQTYRAELRMPEFYDQKDVLGGKYLPGRAEVKTGEFKF